MNQDPPTSAAPPSSGLNRFLQALADILETLIISAILFMVINLVTARARVNGTSMEPTLQNGQLVLVSRLSYKLGGTPQRGDVAVFNFPRDPQQEYVKRVIGLPGDHIVIENGQVWVNGQVLAEPYIAAAPNYKVDEVVPVEQYFVLGDNRNLSYDSHNWGMVPPEYIVGKAVLVYWPFQDFSWIAHFNLNQAAP